MRTRSLADTLRRLPPGHTELMVHPGYVDDALRDQRTRLFESRADEVRLLCSPGIFDMLREEGIELVRHDHKRVNRLLTMA